jgi:hypothetical protein
LLGADLTAIPLLLPAARAGAFHADRTGVTVTAAETAANHALTTLLGALASSDKYYVPLGSSCTTNWQASNGGNSAFLANLRSVRTFITHARYDGAILAAAIPAALQAGGVPTTVDTAPRANVARPGWMEVTFAAQEAGPAQTIEVRFPPYDEAGHSVAMAQPADLAADVQSWLANP